MEDANAIVALIIDFLSLDDTIASDSYQGDFQLPWDIHANEFLRFAKEDLVSDMHHRLVNALSNAKRAMDCQIESLLLAYGL